MKSVLITGCNRGIGLSLVKKFLAMDNPPQKIIATCRDKGNAQNLMSVSQAYSCVKIIEIDLKEFNKYKLLSEEVNAITEGTGLNVLINNAGIATKFTRIGQLNIQQLMDNFVINAVAPLMLSQALIPLLKKASELNKELPVGINRAAIINITSILSSLSQNVEGGFYPYRCSKAALNTATKSLSIDLKSLGILVTAVHPGWCKTDMGGKNAPLDVDYATSTLLQTLQGLTLQESGLLLQYNGEVLPF